MTTFQRRFDIAGDVIHFTKADSPTRAFEVLATIVSERRLLGGTGHIKGGYQCVCFTEAPLPQLFEVFNSTPAERLRYMPFGVLVPKRWLFARGGRPVIYQSDEEFGSLPEPMRYRHVRYEPDAEPPIDFTWEREWRIRTAELRLDPINTGLVVPSDEHLDELSRRHASEQDTDYQLHSPVLSPQLAEHLREPFTWNSYTLEPPALPQFALRCSTRVV